MALITCKNCGKSISDTTEKCIHCGAPVGVDVETTADSADNASVKTENKTEKKINFLAMSDEDQIKLEEEFLDSDPDAFKWYKSFYEKKIISGVMVVLMIPCLLGMLFVTTQDGSIELRIAGIFLLVAFCILAIVFSFSSKGISPRNNKRKQFVYQKRFQRWLKDKKNIEYTPTIWRKSDEAIFESVDIDVEGF